MKSHMLSTVAVMALLALSGCSEANKTVHTETSESQAAAQAEVQTESQRANQFFEAVFMESVNDSPEFQTYLGMMENSGEWDDYSEEQAQKELDRARKNLARLKSEFDYDKLDEATKLSYRLMERALEEEIEAYRWRHHSYPLNQMYGWQSQTPAFLVNFHVIKDEQAAEGYVSRLEKFKDMAEQRFEQLRIREEKGILPPKFVYDYVIDDAKNILSGAPFDDGEDNTLLADLKKKLDNIEISEDKKAELIARAEAALLNSVRPAYEKLIEIAKRQQAATTTDDGAWKLPDGEEYYNFRLRKITTTDMTAEEIHELGLKEVARIHGEMRDIMKKVGFDGSLQDFFEFTRTDKRFYYPETEEGRQAYLEKAKAIINTMKSRLDEVFLTKPKADLLVKAVEPFREKSAGKAFYSRPAPDGSRPGIYYANLYKMSDMPTYQMEALAYHEGIPGHHMQLAIMQELENIPKFRKFGGYTAYTEGWGLYSELLPKEMGFYEDPYSDFGRLAMELWRACRLVVDTGIHYKKWTREQAIDYLLKNTPNPKGDVVKAIERYIVMPGQATAYKIGMLKILELRERAKAELGDKFDIREYHDVVLKDGALPLSILEEKVMDWIARQHGRSS
ncbi:DUF885 domain-containing protein [Luteithermobacter gelatinilyticus]|uniref:DUF885 domain-containing protein n=1 Tax=Luteithermobacter gelatinilyticus TaxID=2582913 RepID=UPI0011057F64|nr:DUF885 domain-containing protein [Luteithermobacter gelatinilyticus]